MPTEKKKKQYLRNNEYYNLQKEFDNLYAKSKNGENFCKLMELITSEQNILLAYRNIKKNKGGRTSGVNHHKIMDLGKIDPQKLVEYVRQRLQDFKPHPVRRVEIDKENGQKRPLGIPTIEDRLIQQAIRQVMEPICEARFHKHSYGFRPNRSTHHAIARTLFLVNIAHYQYVIDLDIKGFFDNVNHGKLLKQLWTMGFRDKQLLCVISKMLKAEINGIGIPDKGVPQGGLLSPLLSNVVLNELDWWISSQWETAKTQTNYSVDASKYQNLIRASHLKQVFFVRFADDVRLFCKDRATVNKIYHAVKMWLVERLGLEISDEKSQIVNLKKKYSEFLGIKLKLWHKSGKWVVKSHLRDKAKTKIKSAIAKRIKAIQDAPTRENAYLFNSTVLGIHNYYRVATNVYCDFERLAIDVLKSLKIRMRGRTTKDGVKSKAFDYYYGDYKGMMFYISKIALFPVSMVRHKPPMCFSQNICNYTSEGRRKIHNILHCVNEETLKYLMENPIRSESMQYNDNRISLYVGQQGKCGVTKTRLTIGNMHAHHIVPRHLGGTDEYGNLIFLCSTAHRLIHATEVSTIAKLLTSLSLDKAALAKINKLRKLVGNCEI